MPLTSASVVTLTAPPRCRRSTRMPSLLADGAGPEPRTGGHPIRCPTRCGLSSPDAQTFRPSGVLAVSESFLLAIESDDVHDSAIAHRENLIPKSRPAALAGILRASHGHTYEKPITEDFYIEHTSSDTGVSTSLIPRQHLVAVLAGRSAGARFSPRHIGVQQLRKCRYVLSAQSLPDLFGDLVHGADHGLILPPRAPVVPDVVPAGAGHPVCG